MNADNLRKVPSDALTAFIKPRWKPLVITPEGIDRRFYEICALSELKNALRSGDIWVKGSRQFRDFEDYLLPPAKFAALKKEQALPLAINHNSDQYLEERLQLLEQQLAIVAKLVKDNELPDAILTESGLKITPLDAAVPDTAQALIDKTSQLLPRIKITELLMDVDEWTGFTRHFTHLKDGAQAKDRTLLLSAMSRHDLFQAVLAASLAHPRRNLLGGIGRTDQLSVQSCLCCQLGRRHHLILGWPALPRRRSRREYRTRQSEVRQ
ncbi:hypothetical protein PS838_00246 [Pseudomonas fluorescens]|nr:hypothetical protein PS838_00246 [Pseudomonas fluorescens]